MSFSSYGNFVNIGNLSFSENVDGDLDSDDGFGSESIPLSPMARTSVSNPEYYNIPLPRHVHRQNRPDGRSAPPLYDEHHRHRRTPPAMTRGISESIGSLDSTQCSSSANSTDQVDSNSDHDYYNELPPPVSKPWLPLGRHLADTAI